MLENEARRQIVLAAIQGLCANPQVADKRPSDIVQAALRIAFELERQAPKGEG